MLVRIERATANGPKKEKNGSHALIQWTPNYTTEAAAQRSPPHEVHELLHEPGHGSRVVTHAVWKED
jgi:hypothetical protein